MGVVGWIGRGRGRWLGFGCGNWDGVLWVSGFLVVATGMVGCRLLGFGFWLWQL